MIDCVNKMSDHVLRIAYASHIMRCKSKRARKAGTAIISGNTDLEHDTDRWCWRFQARCLP